MFFLLARRTISWVIEIKFHFLISNLSRCIVIIAIIITIYLFKLILKAMENIHFLFFFFNLCFLFRVFFFLFFKNWLLFIKISKRRKGKIKIKIIITLKSIIETIINIIIIIIFIKFEKLLEILVWLFALLTFFFKICNWTLKLKTR